MGGKDSPSMPSNKFHFYIWQNTVTNYSIYIQLHSPLKKKKTQITITTEKIALAS